jgi:hypothetical protein
MAIKLLEPIYLERYGVHLDELILSLKGTYRVYYTVNNEKKVYIVSSILYYYGERDKEPVMSEQISYTINENQLSTNLIEYMYLMLKSKYTNYQDV